MAAVYTKGLTGKKQSFIRSYDNFLGLRLSGDESAVSEREFCYLENMYADYDSPSGGSIETMPGYRIVYRFGGEVYGLFRYPVNGKMQIVVHVDNKLYVFPVDKRDSLASLTPVGTELECARSTAFLFRNDFYLLDGTNYYRLSDSGELTTVTENAYVPITYLNSQPYEAKNLLSSFAVERHIIGEPRDHSGASHGLCYTAHADGVSCSVTGIKEDRKAALVIPEKVILQGKTLAVTEIADDAFSFHDFHELHLPNGLTRIGKRAFEGCRNLLTLVLPDTLTTVDTAAFAQCYNLSYVHLGKGLREVGTYAFGACSALQELTYPLEAVRYSEIVSPIYAPSEPANLSDFHERGLVSYMTPAKKRASGGCYYFPISEDFDALSSVTLDGQKLRTTASPFFPVKAESSLPPSMVSNTIAENGYFVFITLKAAPDGSFTATGSADLDGELSFGKVTLSKGHYLLRGIPKGQTGAALTVCYTERNAGFRTSDVGSGAQFTILDDQTEVEFLFTVTEGASFSNSTIFPECVKAHGYVAYTPIQKFDGTKTRVASLALHASVDETLSLLTLDVRGRLRTAEGKAGDSTEATAGASAILGCRLSALYDGRIFLSGNPKFPNSVFYASRTRDGEIDPSYFGAFHYFRDGSGQLENKTMFATPSGLCVIKAGDGEESRVFFHVGEDSDSALCPRIYPAVSGSANAAATGAGLSFRGVPIYLSENGICSISKASIAGEREPTVRSQAINRAILKRDHSLFDLTTWKDYLILSTGDGEVFMADGNKSTQRDFVFYRLSSIGSYVLDEDGYEYAHSIPKKASAMGLAVSPRAGEPVKGKVELLGHQFPYVTENGVRYACMTRGERIGGFFSPATRFLSADDLLYFITKTGALCVFNTDKRDENGRIPAEYYSYAGHRYPSGVAFKMDDCGMPYLTKNTLRHSTVVRLTDFVGGSLHVCARTEKMPYEEIDCLYGGDANFDETDFSNFHFGNDRTTLFPIRERLRRYAEKQYYLYTDDFRCRFGISELMFRFTIGGRIKR